MKNVDSKVENIVALASKLTSEKGNIRDTIRSLLMFPNITVHVSLDKQGKEFIESLLQDYSIVNMDSLISEVGPPIYTNNGGNPFINRYSPIPNVVRREEEIEQVVLALANPKSSLALIVGEDNTGKESIVSSVVDDINNGRIKRLTMHDILTVNSYSLQLAANLGQDSTKILELIFSRISVNRPILLFKSGDIIADSLSKQGSTYNQAAGFIFSTLLKTECPKIILASPKSEYNITRECPGHVSIIQADKFTSDSEQKEIYKATIRKYIGRYPNKNFIISVYGKKLKTSTSKQIVQAANYIIKHNINLPTLCKILDEGTTYVETGREPYIKVTDTLETSLTESIKGLSSYLKKHIIGQDEQIDSLTQVIEKNILFGEGKPLCGSMLAGPTGVGKTETAKRIAEKLYESSDNMLRLDMSEYSEDHTISSLLGSPPGYVGFGGATKLGKYLEDRNKRGGVILFDELEKAAAPVQRVLLNILDYGKLTMRNGITYDLSNYIILATTNANTEKHVASLIHGGITLDKKKLYDTYPKELIGRFDAILLYNKIDNDTLLKIAKQKLDILSERALSKHGITVKYSRGIERSILDKAIDTNGRAVELVVTNNIASTITRFVLLHNKKRVTIGYDKKKECFVAS